MVCPVVLPRSCSRGYNYLLKLDIDYSAIISVSQPPHVAPVQSFYARLTLILWKTQPQAVYNKSKQPPLGAFRKGAVLLI